MAAALEVVAAAVEATAELYNELHPTVLHHQSVQAPSKEGNAMDSPSIRRMWVLHRIDFRTLSFAHYATRVLGPGQQQTSTFLNPSLHSPAVVLVPQ
jgi:hypothetical protein